MKGRPDFGTLLREALGAPGTGGPVTLRRLLALALVLPPFLLLQALHWMGFWLDDVLYSGFRKVEVREPLFVVGLPRSGTTTLHRVLAQDRERFTTLRLWELLLAPSVTERKAWLALGRLDRALGRPFGRILGWAEGRLTAFMEEVHPVSLAEPEEDYLLLLPAFASFILVLAFPDHPAIWRLTRLDRESPEEADALAAFYRECVQRHLYVAGPEKQLLSKNPQFTPLVQALGRAFPDARFVACLRDPLKVVPSQLSSLEAGARFFGWRVGDPPYRDRLVEMLADYGEHLSRVLAQFPREQQACTVLSRMARDIPGTLEALYHRFGWVPSPRFRAALQEEGERGRRHASGHRYTLEEYGLTQEETARRFAAFQDWVSSLEESA